MVKTLENLLIQNELLYDHETWHGLKYGLRLNKVYVNYNPELVMTYFTTMSNLAKLVLIESQISGERL